MGRDRARWTSPDPLTPPEPGAWLAFLGLGGSPINLVTQVRPTGGFIIRVPDLMLHVDPGPGAIVWANHHGFDLTQLDAVYISHGHTDHFGGAPPVIEAMCKLMMRRRGHVIAPPSVFARGLVSDYHRGEAESAGIYRGGPTVLEARPGEDLVLGETRIRPQLAYHGGENYGFVLEHAGLRIGYTSDTSYITRYRDADGVEREPGPAGGGELARLAEISGVREDLRRTYADVDILIANVGFYDLFAHRHVTAVGLAHLLAGSRVQRCFMIHLGTVYFQPEDTSTELARWVEVASGVPCVVPALGHRYLLPLPVSPSD